MEKQEIRWVQRLDSYRKAFERMNEAVEMISLYSIKNRETELLLDALIQRYEFTHELAWKLMKDYLEYMGISGIVGSRDAIRYALQNGLIDDDRWMDSIVDRNITSHNYDQEIAIEIAGRIISIYQPLFDKFLQVMSKKESLL
ncbi:MAG: nucleotidyltransferase substrate binding protein [Bacteroidales bacterium]|nr:nucleotidyltransferase substrate binding protein [Bacteroidales bacterium]